MKPIKYSDHLEQSVGDLLTKRGIRFYHESQRKELCLGLDFFLPDYGVFIEVKQYDSERTAEQLKRAENIILIQGKASINFLKAIL